MARQGTLPQQLLHALTNNKWINKWQSQKYAYLPTVHTYWQNSSTYRRMWWHKLPVRAWWCRTGHKKFNTLLQNKQKKNPKQSWSTFRYRTPVRAFKKIFTDKGVDASGWQRSSEGPCPRAPSPSMKDQVESPLKPEEAPPLTSLAPGMAPWVLAQSFAEHLKNQTRTPSQTSLNTLLPYICG